MKNNPISDGVRRIGIDGRVLQETHKSGIPSYAYNIITEILNIDTKNRYILFFNSFRKVNDIIPVFKQKNVEVVIYHFPNKLLEWGWKILPYPKIDRLLNVDTFFSPHFLNIPLSRKVDKVVTIHDLSFEENKNYFSITKNIWHWQMNPKKICNYYNKIIAVSRYTKYDLINKYKINSDKIKVIHNGVSDYENKLITGADNSILEKYNLEKNKYILFVSTLEPRKNIEGIIDSFCMAQKQTGLKLVIAGKKGWSFNNIFKKAKKISVGNNILFTGFIAENEKTCLYENARYFIFPSFFEGFGIPLIEARKHLLPTISTVTSSIPEVTGSSTINVNPHIISDIAQSMILLNNNNPLRMILKNKMISIKNKQWRDAGKETLEYILLE